MFRIGDKVKVVSISEYFDSYLHEYVGDVGIIKSNEIFANKMFYQVELEFDTIPFLESELLLIK